MNESNWRQSVEARVRDERSATSDSFARYRPVIVSAKDIAAVELCRERLEVNSLERIQNEIFLLGLGESEDRLATKIGGIPALPAHRTWPISDGEPMTFLAQFNFNESMSIVPYAPADLLLVFMPAFLDLGCPDILHFEWIRLADAAVLSKEFHPPSFELLTAFGVGYRSWDLVESEVEWHNLLAKLPHRESLRTYEFWSGIFRLPGLKIGGLPYRARPALGTDKGPGPGRYLCGFSTVHPVIGEPWPWLNREEPYLDSECSYGILNDSALYLNSYGGFSLQFFLSPDGAVRHTFEAII